MLPAQAFSIGSTARSADPAATAANTAPNDSQGTASSAAPAYSSAAPSLWEQIWPRNATRIAVQSPVPVGDSPPRGALTRSGPAGLRRRDTGFLGARAREQGVQDLRPARPPRLDAPEAGAHLVPAEEQLVGAAAAGLRQVQQQQGLHQLLILRIQRTEGDELRVAAPAEGVVQVEDIGQAAGHAGREVAPGGAEHQDDPAGHILAAVVAHALDHGEGAAVADGEALAGLPRYVERPARGPVEQGIAGDRVRGRPVAGRGRRPHDDHAAGHAFADIVVDR